VTPTTVLIDTGPIVSLFSVDDHHHETCVETAAKVAVPALTCWPVITEAAYLLRKRIDAVVELLARCAGTHFEILSLDQSDLRGIREILRTYRDQRFQLADACLMYLAGRERINTVFTLDLKDFSVFRIPGQPPLTILPQVP